MINSIEDIEILEKYGKQMGAVITHLKIDTGMCRMGARFDKTELLMNRLSEKQNIHVEAVFSHFSTAEEDDNTVIVIICLKI